MRNIFKSLFIAFGCLVAGTLSADDATFTMASIFDGSGLSFDVTSPVAANVSSNTSKSNAKAGKLGSDGHYFQIVLISNTFTVASINGFINTTNTEKNWAFQFSTDGGTTWSEEATQANDGNKTAHDISVEVSIPSNANGFRVVRRAGTSTQVNSITLTVDGSASGGGETEKSHDATLKSLTYGTDHTSVDDFSADKLSYSVILPSDYVGGAPSIQAETNHEKANVDIAQASSLPGTAKAVVTAEDGTTKKTYTVAFSKEGEEPATIAVTGVTLDRPSLTLKVGQTYSLIAQIIPSDATNQNVSWSSNSTAATVSAGVVSAKAEGTATITVKTEDGGFEATCEVTVQKDDTPTPPVPSTGLTLHEPGLYEEAGAKGGYETPLSDFGGREYEVFYAGRWDNGGTKLTIHVNPVDKSQGITKNETNSSYEAIDGWFKGSGSDKGTGFAAKDEFKKATERCHTVTSSNSIEMHVNGYDQFSLYAADKKWEPSKPANCKYFKVIIDDAEQTMEQSTNQTIRRFDIDPTRHHVIKITLVGDGNLFGGFSLRVAQIPMVKYIKGNDSTQVVLQTEKLPRDIVYFTKYNNKGVTKVIWENGEARGIELVRKSSTDIGDTLLLTGVANCPVGVYPFHISSFDSNGNETKRLPSGKITVKSDIHAIGDTVVEVYAGEAMEEMTFSYHALDAATDIHIAWKDDNKPNGIDGHGEDGTYYISGTPTQQGEYPFTISVTGGNSVNGIIKVLPPIVGDNLVLYLYTNGDKETILAKDGIAALLSTQFTIIPRKAQKTGLRPATDYQKYQWALISEDANADNAEVLELTKASATLPVLNMKSFAYADERLSWGDPNNGSLTENGQYITVQREDHPIFKTLSQIINISKGSKIKVLKKKAEKMLMPIDINLPGTHCLATSLARNRDNYEGDGEVFTFLHEVPAGMRGGKKYICMPIAMSSSQNLTTEGQYLLASVVNYLLNDEPSIQRPDLQINSFIIDGISGNIDQSNDRITFEIDLTNHDVDKHAIKPEITLADAVYTHVSTKFEKEDGSVDFSESLSFPVTYEVSDYINRRVYEVAIRFFNSEGIEDVYAAGDWVNIYDIFGRKVSTTNEDIYHMVLPRGVYVIVTETGQTFKIMR